MERSRRRYGEVTRRVQIHHTAAGKDFVLRT